MAIQCPKCKYHAEHIYTFETGKHNTLYAIERCPNCQYAGWTDNPIKYDDYLRMRRRRERTSEHREKQEDGGRDIWNGID